MVLNSNIFSSGFLEGVLLAFEILGSMGCKAFYEGPRLNLGWSNVAVAPVPTGERSHSFVDLLASLIPIFYLLKIILIRKSKIKKILFHWHFFLIKIISNLCILHHHLLLLLQYRPLLSFLLKLS